MIRSSANARLPVSGRLPVVLLLLAPLACADSTGPGDDTEGTGQDQDFVLFVRGDENSTLWRVNLDGTGLEQLLDADARISGLRLSPDAGQVAFYSDMGSCYDVWTMNVDGTDLRQLTGVEASERCNYNPKWSPDGSKIAFYSSRNVTEGRGWDAYVIDADGTGLVEVGGNPSTELGTNNDMTDGWSADGEVVLLSDRDGTARTYLVGPDGSGRELFMDGYVSPSWSPDGTKVAYHVEDAEESLDIWVMGAGGTGAVNVTAHPAWDIVPAWASSPWSPDGGTLAFGSSRTGDHDVWAVGPDGTGLRNLTNDPASDTFLAWSPDGTRFLFTSDRAGSRDLYLADADGSDVVRLTDHADDEDQAVWVPAG